MELKTIKELKQICKERFFACRCESIAILFIAAGIFLAVILSGLIVIQAMHLCGVLEYGPKQVFFNGTIGFYIITAVIISAVIILSTPLQYGICWFFYRAVNGMKAPVSCIFSCYINPKHFKKTLVIGTVVFVSKLFLLVPIAVVAAVEMGFAEQMLVDRNSFIYTLVAGCHILIFSFMLFIYVIFSAKYSIVPFIYSQNPDKSVRYIISESTRIIRGNEQYMLRLYIIMAAYILLSLPVFTMMYTVPYMSMMMAAASDNLIKYNSSECEEEEDAPIMEENIFV